MAGLLSLPAVLWALAHVRRASSQTCSPDQCQSCKEVCSEGTINFLCGSPSNADAALLAWCDEMAANFNEQDPLQQVIVTKAENFGDFVPMMTEDQDSGLNLYNLYLHAMGLHVGTRGHTWADLTDMVRMQQDGLRWDKVGTFFQKSGALWDGKVKIMPLDGDFHSLFYRLDLFEEYNKDPPVQITLEEFVEIGESFQGRDLNGDGEPDFGICFPHWGYASPWYFLSLLAPWLQSKGSSQGIFFDPETMEPLFDNAATKEVIRLWKRTWMLPDPMDRIPVGEGSTLQAFHDGRCAMAVGWDEHFLQQRNTWVNGKVGVTRVPGTTRVWDRGSKELILCTPELCPHAIERPDGRLVNFAPYNAFNGFSMAINGASSVAQVNTAFAFMAFLMNEENRRLVVHDGFQLPDNRSVTLSAVSPDMYDPEGFVQSGFVKASVDTYVENGRFSISSENTALELRFKGSTMGIYKEMMDLLKDYYREEGEYNTTSQGGTTARAAADEDALTTRVAAAVQSMWAREVAADPAEFRATYHKMLGIYDGPAACRFGEHFVAANGTCEVCPAGRFGSYDKLSCQECSAGSAASQAGMSLCRECAPGTYQNVSGQELCLNCTAGRYSADAASSECSDCPAGRHMSDVRAVGCTKCPVGAHQSRTGQSLCVNCPSGQITSEWTMVQGRYEWVPMEGADNVSVCGCGTGTRLLAGICTDCGDKDVEGLSCRGKDDVIVAQGFYAEDTSFSVFKCHGHAGRCIGGEPGNTCAAGREGLACALCKEGFKDSNDGECVPCDSDGPGQANFIVFSIGGCILLFGLYVVVDRGRGTRPSHMVLLLSLVFSMSVTLVQQLGIISLFEDVAWMDPIRSLLKIFQVLVFDVEVLHVNCVVRMSPLQMFIMQVTGLGMAIVVLLVAHTLLTAIAYKAAFVSRMPALLASVGTIFLALYISVVTAVLGPFQCLSHPNREQTVRSFPSVICWETSEHHTMIAIAALAVQVPLVFFAYCCNAVRKYPGKMSKGNMAFLQVHNWLFFRFKPEVYWYSIVFMSRSLLLAIVPIIPNSPAQIISMDIVMIVQLMLVVGVKPWRLEYVNILDNFFTVSTLMILICASFYIDWVSASALAWFACILVVLCILALPIIGALTIVLWLVARNKKRFDYFLCHHKAGAGAFTRLLKLQLKMGRVKREVFVDADNLSTLDTLFDFVANKTDTLVMVGSKDLLQRPWCMGEITTAKAAMIKTFKLALPDFSNPTEEFVEGYADIVGDLTVLTNNGITLSAAQDAIRWFREQSEVGVPVELTDWSLKEVSGCILRNTYHTMVGKESSSRSEASTGLIKIIVDIQSLEACSAGILVSRMLGPHFADKPAYLPQLVYSGEDISENVTHGLLICSAGALEKECVIQTLATAVHRQVPIVPILVEDGFQFPSKSFAEEHRSLLSRVSDSSDEKEIDASLNSIRDIFMTIGIGFPAKMASEAALLTKAQEIAARLDAMIVDKKATKRSAMSLSTTKKSALSQSPRPGQPTSARDKRMADGKRENHAGDEAAFTSENDEPNTMYSSNDEPRVHQPKGEAVREVDKDELQVRSSRHHRAVPS